MHAFYLVNVCRATFVSVLTFTFAGYVFRVILCVLFCDATVVIFQGTFDYYIISVTWFIFSECMTCSSNPSIVATAVVGWRCNTVTRSAKWNISSRLTILAGIISTLWMLATWLITWVSQWCSATHIALRTLTIMCNTRALVGECHSNSYAPPP